MEKKITLSESELRKLIRKEVDKRMNEVELGAGSNAKPATDASVKIVTKTLDADSLFATGKSQPNTDSQTFKNVVTGIVNSATASNIKKPIEVKVQGGASAVGSPGFNNKMLADKRRDNMIVALTQEVVRQITTKLDTTTAAGFSQNDYVKFTPLQSVVGVATVKDSPEAKKEQFVKITYPTTALAAKGGTTAIDRTATVPGSNKEKGGLTPVGSEDDTNKQLKGFKPVNVFTTDKKTKFTFPQNGYDELNAVLNKYKLYLPINSKQAPKGES